MTFDIEIPQTGTAAATAFIPHGTYQMAYIEPPAELASLVTTFYIFRSEDALIRDVQPAGIGHLMFFLKGRGQARFQDGHVDDSHDVSLICPSNAAMQYSVAGPFHCFGCAFTPIGWRSLTGEAANKRMDQLLPASALLSQDCADIMPQLRAIDDGYPASEADDYLMPLGQSLLDALLPQLLHCFTPVSRTLAQRVAKVAAWLEADYSPKLDDLAQILALSDRQMQRFVTENFGCSPKFLARKYRAIRVAMALSDPRTTEAQREALHDLFYDQSHMIRELRHFVGKTPAGLAQEDNGLLQMWLDPDNIREIKPSQPQH